jgi:hypothetical protein
MPFKWERFYLMPCFRLNKLSFFAYLNRFFKEYCYAWSWAFLFFVFSLPAHAIITMSPTNGGSLGGNPSYYFVTFSGATPVALPAFLAPNVVPLDITQSAYGGSEAASGYPNRFEINFYSDVNPPALAGTQQVVVTFQSYPLASSPIHPAPIATVNGRACDNSICQGLNVIPGISSSNHYYAVRYTPQTNIRIGFYPQDICADYTAAGGDAVGCTGGSVTPLSATAVTTMQLSYAITIVSDSVSYPTASPTPAPVVVGRPVVATVIDQTTDPISYTLENILPTLSCPDTNTLNGSVIPGDGQIFLNTTAFAFSTPNSTLGAPGSGLIVVGQDTSVTAAAPDVSPTYASKNSIAAPIALGSPLTPVVGFKNSTSADVHAYQVSFIGQDRAGVYAGPASVSGCLLNPVETATIQGFLGKSNCFVATAAFGSIDSSPVLLLREFRDSILLPSPVGRSFVKWYYHWSPPAAEWLTLHPAFRLPVLLFLSPLEAIAWLCLHPTWVSFFGLALLGLLAALTGNEILKREKELR